MQGECDKFSERALHVEAALAAALEAHHRTQGALIAETNARTEAEAKVRRMRPDLPAEPVWRPSWNAR